MLSYAASSQLKTVSFPSGFRLSSDYPMPGMALSAPQMPSKPEQRPSQQRLARMAARWTVRRARQIAAAVALAVVSTVIAGWITGTGIGWMTALLSHIW